jgi:hypothetical protein
MRPGVAEDAVALGGLSVNQRPQEDGQLWGDSFNFVAAGMQSLLVALNFPRPTQVTLNFQGPGLNSANGMTLLWTIILGYGRAATTLQTQDPPRVLEGSSIQVHARRTDANAVPVGPLTEVVAFATPGGRPELTVFSYDEVVVPVAGIVAAPIPPALATHAVVVDSRQLSVGVTICLYGQTIDGVNWYYADATEGLARVTIMRRAQGFRAGLNPVPGGNTPVVVKYLR